MPYVVVVNVPGYLPESDPTYCATLADARETAASEVAGSPAWLHDTDGDTFAIRRQYDAAERAAETLPAEGAVIALPDGYVVDVRPIDAAELARLREH